MPPSGASPQDVDVRRDVVGVAGEGVPHVAQTALHPVREQEQPVAAADVADRHQVARRWQEHTRLHLGWAR